MPQRPNILLVVADQLVPFLTGVYGHPLVRTTLFGERPLLPNVSTYRLDDSDPNVEPGDEGTRLRPF